MPPRSAVGDHFGLKPYHLCDRRLRRPAPLVAHQQCHDHAGKRRRGENPISDGMSCDIARHPVSNAHPKFKHPFKKDASREQE